jgi:hypothetical protein
VLLRWVLPAGLRTVHLLATWVTGRWHSSHRGVRTRGAKSGIHSRHIQPVYGELENWEKCAVLETLIPLPGCATS